MSTNDVLSVPKRAKRLWSICRAAEREEIARVLQEHGQNRTHAAVALGISRRTLLNKIKQFGLRESQELAGSTAVQSALAAN